MPSRKLLLLDRADSPWKPLLENMLEDTSSVLTHGHTASSAGALVASAGWGLIFVETKFLSLSLEQRLKVWKTSHPDGRLIQLGKLAEGHKTLAYDASFEDFPSSTVFQRRVAEILPLKDPLTLLVVDDEPEIRAAISGFLAMCTHPAFRVMSAEDGEVAVDILGHENPDCALLDLKMPGKSGLEVYSVILKRKQQIPVIILFDAVSGDEISEIHALGRPAIIEKGTDQSCPEDIAALIKKMVYFA